jgi:hypothetical protein
MDFISEKISKVVSIAQSKYEDKMTLEEFEAKISGEEELREIYNEVESLCKNFPLKD